MSDEGRYRTIVVDPPWEYRDTFGGFNAAGKGKLQRRALPYPSLSVKQICDLPVAPLADGAGANIFLWATNRHLPAAFEVLKAWGFGYRQTLVWRKTGANPLWGSIAVNTCEFLLFGKIHGGAPHGKLEDAVVSTKRVANAHSRKPDLFLDRVESVSPGPYLELFARRNRLGWDTWGNEALNHVEVTA